MPANPIVLVEELEAFQAGDAQAAIDDATAVVRGYCGWHITPSLTEIVTVDGAGRAALMLPSLHVTAIVSVVANGTPVDLADVTWSEAGFLLREAYPYSWSGPVVVAFTHGWAEAPDVAMVIKAVATRGQASPGGGFVRQVGQVAYQQPTGDGGGAFLESEKAILRRYRVPSST